MLRESPFEVFLGQTATQSQHNIMLSRQFYRETWEEVPINDTPAMAL